MLRIILGWFLQDKYMIHNRKRNRWYSGSVSLLFGCLLSPLFFPAFLFADPIKAFPGAEDFGAWATGGRGGKVYLAETLEDYNPNEGEKPIPGSLREAIDAEGPRIVIFRVSGNIDLERNLNHDNDLYARYS
jgi:hypothetical protein